MSDLLVQLIDTKWWLHIRKRIFDHYPDLDRTLTGKWSLGKIPLHREVSELQRRNHQLASLLRKALGALAASKINVQGLAAQVASLGLDIPESKP